MNPRIKYLIEREYAAQRSDEWLKLRGKMLTASDVATAIGCNKYEKPEDLILKKCGYKKFNGNFATAHGNKYEDEARDKYCELYDEVCHEIGLFPHEKYDWLGGSPDGVTESGRLVEIKCPLTRKIIEEVPEHYMPQLQLLMEILELEVCDFIQYKPAEVAWPEPEQFLVLTVERDREWFKKYLPVMDTFWKRVLHHREHGVEDILPKRKRTPKVTKEIKCEIIEDPLDDYQPNTDSPE